MKIAVTDANIFIDLLYMEMQLLLLKLELEIYTTQFVLDELEEEQITKLQQLANEKTLIVYPFTDEELKKL